MRNGLVKSLYKLKHSKTLRLFFIPFKNLEYVIEDSFYCRGEDSRYIRSIRNIMAGKRCFIIGNGPSLRLEDLERLKGEYTFASNRIYHVFEQTAWRPTYYCAFDPEFIAQESRKLGTLEVERSFVARNPVSVKNLRMAENVTFINCHPTSFGVSKHSLDGISFSDDPSKVIGMGYTVTFIALQLAIWMGFNEIYLIGMDHQYSVTVDDKEATYTDSKVTDHFFNDDPSMIKALSYLEGMEYAYQLARKEAEVRNVRIFNATRGGKLEVFERVDLDNVLNRSLY